jgi:Rieske Fe-S protein
MPIEFASSVTLRGASYNIYKFICPCHNSQFDQQGAVENPPAPRPLDLFALTIEDGEVKVDTGNIIQRQTYDMAQVIYP